jgi:predicted transcriptional regulator
MPRRERLEIITTILNICMTRGANKTRIVYQANLNFKNAGVYLDWLMKRGFLSKEGNIYRTTPSGLTLLDSLKVLIPLINEESESSLSQASSNA